MRRMTTTLLLLLTALALALPGGLSRAAEAKVKIAALLPADENWYEYGTTKGSQYGQSVASAGDVNHDGYADIIVGAPFFANSNEDKVGAAFIYLGSSAGVDSKHNVVELLSTKKGSNFGAAVSSAGDVNNDGYDDVIIGAPKFHDSDSIGANGKVYVYHGSSSGLETTPAWSTLGEDESELGCAVAGVGDVNGDHFDDVLVGACTLPIEVEGTKIEGVGAVYLFLGSNAGLHLTPAWSVIGFQKDQRLGNAVARLGDLNKDGYADLAVGSSGFDVNVTTLISAGAVHVWYGAAAGPALTPTWSAFGGQYLEAFGYSVSGAGDVDGNGYVDLVVGSRGFDSTYVVNVGGAYVFTNTGGMLNTAPYHIYTGKQGGDGFGMAVAGVGDLNHDGYADVAVGAPYCDANATNNNEGCVYVYRGAILGLSKLPSWVGRGGKAETEFGLAVSGAGDVNGDTYSDLIVGAPIFKWDDKDPYGKAAVYHGAFSEEDPTYRFYLPVVNN